MRYLVPLVIALCSCGGGGGTPAPEVPSDSELVWKGGNGSYLHMVEVEGHDYLVFRGFYKGGVTHHEGCKHEDHE